MFDVFLLIRPFLPLLWLLMTVSAALRLAISVGLAMNNEPLDFTGPDGYIAFIGSYYWRGYKRGCYSEFDQPPSRWRRFFNGLRGRYGYVQLNGRWLLIAPYGLFWQ